jgi:hypothetical protein
LNFCTTKAVVILTTKTFLRNAKICWIKNWCKCLLWRSIRYINSFAYIITSGIISKRSRLELNSHANRLTNANIRNMSFPFVIWVSFTKRTKTKKRNRNKNRNTVEIDNKMKPNENSLYFDIIQIYSLNKAIEFRGSLRTYELGFISQPTIW